MALVIEGQVTTRLPIGGEELSVTALAGLSASEISRKKIWYGRNRVEVGQLFRVTGALSEDQTIVWEGSLTAVHGIGAGMEAGWVRIETAAGRHVGARMRGGNLVAASDVSDFAGAEMVGGLIRIQGNAGDGLGGVYSGTKIGGNRGVILVQGNAGRGLGRCLRRGLIAVAGNVGPLCGWGMRAGTILVGGQCERECGSGMIRGTIVLANQQNYEFLPSFRPGSIYSDYLIRLLAGQLKRLEVDWDERLLGQRFHMHHGDGLSGGRGEVFGRC